MGARPRMSRLHRAGILSLCFAIGIGAMLVAALNANQQAHACGYRPMGSLCDGMSAGRPLRKTIEFISEHDSQFAMWLLTHNEFGHIKCGWRPGLQ